MTMHSLVTLVLLAVVGAASSASAVVLTGGPVYSLPGGGTCTATNITSTGSGATFTCSGVNLGAHTKVYVGIRNDTNVNGNTMTGSAPTGGSAAVFRISSTTASSITYISTTTVGDLIHGSQTVNNQLVLSTGSPVSVVAAAGNPVNNANGDISNLFQLTSGSTFTFTVQVKASDPFFGLGLACPAVYDPSHAAAGAGGDISKVDLAFYYSDCGDGQVDSPEACDLGVALNGASGSCCSSTCTFQPSGTLCRASAGVCDAQEVCTGSNANCPSDSKVPSGTTCRASGGVCDVAEVCNGVANTCPADGKVASGTQCRASAGICDIAEVCDGAGNSCPPDTIRPSGFVCRGPAGVCDVQEVCDGSSVSCPTDGKVASGTVCRAAADFCDVAEVCNGVADACPADSFKSSSVVCRAAVDVCDATENCTGSGAACPSDAKVASGTTCRASAGGCDVVEQCDGSSDACPADVIRPSGYVCNAGSGDLCDPDETCDGSSTACPVDTVAPSGTLCRAGSGDSCDPDEVCTGVADQPCPADVVEPTSTVCRPGSGDSCDPDEFCPGVPAGTCAADVVAPSGTVCNPGSGDLCDPDEVCSGVAGQTCPSDTVAPSGTVCRIAAGPCDVSETCTGAADTACPADAKVASGTVCRADAGACDVAEVCDGVANSCPPDSFEPDGTSCSDGLYCNGEEKCQTGVCTDGPNPCTFVCNELTDTCETNACPTSPSGGCRTAQKNLLLIKNNTFDGKDKLIWKFINGAATTQPDFADPRSTADYALCIYAGTVNVATMNVPPTNLNWRALSTKGYKYLDQSLSQDGIQKIILKGTGVAGKTKALVKGRADNLPDPLNGGPLTLPVTAQLLNYQTGICWEGTFTVAKKNEQTIFKAKNP